MNKRFYSGKTYSHSTGHSCAFRQWKADSHCNLIHGYALQFEFTFGGDELDSSNWIVDFGGLKPLKEWLKFMFDHTYLLGSDDPEFETFQRKNLERHLVSMHKRILNQLQLTAEERYDLFLEQYPDIEQHTPNYHIASYLGITQQSLSRIRVEKTKK